MFELKGKKNDCLIIWFFFTPFWRVSKMCSVSIDQSMGFLKCPCFLCILHVLTFNKQVAIYYVFVHRFQSLQELRRGGRGLMQLFVTVNSSYMMCLKENPPSLELLQVKSWISGLYFSDRVETLCIFFSDKIIYLWYAINFWIVRALVWENSVFRV